MKPARPAREILRACLELDAPLSARLKMMADDLRRREPGYSAMVDRLAERLLAAGSGVHAPKVGEPMPPFVLPDENDRLVSLAGLLEKGQVVIAFHRGHWCPFCRITAAALAEIEAKAAASGGQLVVITPDLPRFNRLLKEEARARFPVLTDLDCGYALQLQLAVRYPAELIEDMKQTGRDFASFQNNENWIFPIPATFVIGQDGIVKARHVDPDYRKRMELDDLLAALDR